LGELRGKTTRLLHAIPADENLEQPSVRHPGETVRRAIVHALHDEACHGGEIQLLPMTRAVAKQPT